jgi:hypothetical protein
MKQSVSHYQLMLAFFAAALTVLFLAPLAHADEWDKKTILTVNETIQVQDAVLQPGQYVMKLLNSSTDRHVVQIFNGRENHVVATILTIPKERMEATGNTQFTYYETPSGTARAMRAWYYPGDLTGQEFRYPKHPYQLVAMNSTPALPPTAEQPPAEPTSVAAQPATETAQPAPTTDMADAAPPAAVPEQAPTASDQTPAPPANTESQPPAPAELPKTASPYPLVGFCGSLLFAAGCLLRLRQRSAG